MMRTPITVSAVESVGTVEPEPRPVIAIARVDDDANRRRGSVATARQAPPPRPLRRGRLFLHQRQERFVTFTFHSLDWNAMEGGRVNGVTLSTGRFRVGKDIA